MKKTSNKTTFSEILRQELENHITLDHPIFEYLVNTKDKEMMKKMSLQGYQLTKYFFKMFWRGICCHFGLKLSSCFFPYANLFGFFRCFSGGKERVFFGAAARRSLVGVDPKN